MDIKKFCKRLFRLVLRMTGFILSCAFSVIVAVLFFSFSILKGFIAPPDKFPIEDDRAQEEPICRCGTDAKGNLIVDNAGMHSEYPPM